MLKVSTFMENLMKGAAVRSFLVMLLAALASNMTQGAWAQTLNISELTAEEAVVDPGTRNFTEPVVTLTDGDSKLITNRFNITYAISGQTDHSLTNSRGAEITTDPATGATVEWLYGEVQFGKAGTVTIEVTATPKAAYASEYETKTDTYSVTVKALEPQLAFTPGYAAVSPTITLNSTHTVAVNPWNASQWDSTIKGSKAALPSYRITYENKGGVTTDITDRYTLSTDLSNNIAGLSIDSKNNIIYAGHNTQSFSSEAEALADFPTVAATLTYTFTPKAEYEGYYQTLTKEVSVRVVKIPAEKQQLSLMLTRDMIQEENVTSDSEGNYCIHVYKYGLGDKAVNNNYQYFTPNPALITPNGTALPMRGSNTSGVYGDFSYMYQIVSDETYADNCRYAPFWNNESDVAQPAGQPTGINITDDKFQVALTGLVKVAVYAVLPADNDSYGTDLRAAYKPLVDGDGNPLVLDGQWGAKYIPYTEPVYFYIDVMKRVPSIEFSPNPSEMKFVVGDHIDVTNRFDVSGHINDRFNGIEGHLIWGGSNNSTIVNGKEVDHFAYTFFISQHAAQVIKIHDWPYFTSQADWEAHGGDQYSYIDYQEVKSTDKIANNANAHPMVGDKVKLGDGTYVEVTDANYDEYKELPVRAGDLLKGITYYSTKGYGAAFEQWYMEFEYAGDYDITYTIRPYNHTRWDVGSSEAGTVTYTYQVQNTIPTVITASPEIQVATKGDGWNFDESVAKVVVPSASNLDVTGEFNLSYTIDGTDISTVTDPDGHTGTYTVDNATGTMVNTQTGEVFIGNTATGDVRIRITAEKKSSDCVYDNPTVPGFYLIRIVAPTATWEVTSNCRTADPDDDGTLSGKFHFLTSGTFHGGLKITGVPGITAIVGNAAVESNEWEIQSSGLSGLGVCCKHDGDTGNAYASAGNVQLDADGIPTDGTYYSFTPSANGFIWADANWAAGSTSTLITRDSATGEIRRENFAGNGTKGEHQFQMALKAGETYYLYNATSGQLHLHGFRYECKFVTENNTAATETYTAFMNGFSGNLPTLVNGENSNVVFQDAILGDVTYATFNEAGQLTPLKMTINADGTIFSVPVAAIVKAPGAADDDCINQTVTFNLQIIDIPTYIVKDQAEYDDVQQGSKVRTTNIPTAITMTFGGWEGNNGSYLNAKGDKTITDGWDFKSAGGAASRIASEYDDNNPEYNKTIDGFEFFNAAAQNPIDENRTGALVKDDDNPEFNYNYNYASGTEAELNADVNYNTTYRLPARGAYVKFEPRESGVVLAYLVQNGSIDYHYGVNNITDDSKKYYQVKWRPLYITDETGEPCTMATSFGDASKYLPTGTDATHLGYFTLGISRCSKNESFIESLYNYDSDSENTMEGCSFDWSEFRGTANDRSALMDAWKDKGEREDIVRLDNGGFVLPHKAYVRYAFNVKAGKTYFIFQPGSKFEFGGFSFVPAGYPATSTYGLTWTDTSDADPMNWTAPMNDAATSKTATPIYWNDQTAFNTMNQENLDIDVYDCTEDAATQTVRKFTADNWTSVCLPFSVSENEAKRVFGEGYWLITADGVIDNGKTLHFTRHVNSYIEAGRPYLIKPSQSGEFRFRNVSVEGTHTVAALNEGEKVTACIAEPQRFNLVTDGGDSYEYTFKGIYNQETMYKGSFFAAATGLYRYNANSTIGGYRAYFALPEELPLQSKVMIFGMTDKFEEDIDGESNVATGIMYIEDDRITTFPMNCGVYTVGGQKLGEGAEVLKSLPRGIYVVNGKKITVK